MKVASIADIKAHFSEYMRSAEQGPIVVTRSGKAVGVLLAVQDEDELERLLMANSPKLRALLQSARKRMEAGASLSHQEVWGKQERAPKRKSSRRKK